MLPHECFPVCDNFNSDSLEKFSSMVYGGHILEKFGEDRLYRLTTVVMILIGLDKVVCDLVESVVVDLGRRHLVELGFDDCWDAHQFADSLCVDFRLFHTFTNFGLLSHQLKQLHRIYLLLETLEHLRRREEVTLLDSVVFRAETSD